MLQIAADCGKQLKAHQPRIRFSLLSSLHKYFKKLAAVSSGYYFRSALKVPKREIFDRSDFHDFYTIKPLRVGDFGVKTEKKFKNI